MALMAKVALEALAHFGRPEIFNPDQGSQSTGAAFTGTLASAGILKAYVCSYYNEVRAHLSLNKDAPIHRPNRRLGRIISISILGGLHHQYAWH